MKLERGGLLPPPGLEATMPKGLTASQKIALWADLVDATEELVKAGLRNKLGPDGDVSRAFRDWLERQYEEHDRTLIQMRLNLLRMDEGISGRKEDEPT